MPSRGELAYAAARTWVHTPFHWEQCLKGVGCDCRGVLTGAARDCGFPEAAALEANLVGYSRRINEAKLLAGLDRLFDRQPLDIAHAVTGDVLAFRIQRKVQHLGIYGRDGLRHTMVHAYSGEPYEVVEVPLGQFWLGRLAGVWRWRSGD